MCNVVKPKSLKMFDYENLLITCSIENDITCNVDEFRIPILNIWI